MKILYKMVKSGHFVDSEEITSTLINIIDGSSNGMDVQLITLGILNKLIETQESQINCNSQRFNNMMALWNNFLGTARQRHRKH